MEAVPWYFEGGFHRRLVEAVPWYFEGGSTGGLWRLSLNTLRGVPQEACGGCPLVL